MVSLLIDITQKPNPFSPFFPSKHFVFRSADKIIVLDKGEIVEEGPHDKLMMAKGSYYQLVLKQVRKDEEADETSEESSLDLDNKLAEEVLEKEAVEEEDEDVEEVISTGIDAKPDMLNGGDISIPVAPETTSDMAVTVKKPMLQRALSAVQVSSGSDLKYTLEMFMRFFS